MSLLQSFNWASWLPADVYSGLGANSAKRSLNWYYSIYGFVKPLLANWLCVLK